MNKFKDSMQRWIISGLFREIAQKDTYILFTLEEARQLFIGLNDPTGYLFSTAHLGGYTHWVALKESPSTGPHIAKWEEELEVKLRAEGLNSIYQLSKGDKGYQAAKFLADGGWKEKTTGRPTKEHIKRESRIQASIYDEFKPSLVK